MTFRKTTLLLLFVVTAALSFGQESRSLKIDKSSGRTAGEFWKTLREQTSSSFSVGYQQTNFFNTLYYYNIENGTIENQGGYWVTYSFNVTPVMFDISYFRSYYHVDSDYNYYPDYSDKSTFHQGVSAFVSYAPLLPDFGRFSEIVRPYIGVGYQNSGLKAVVPKNEQETADIGSKGTSGAIWKSGIQLQFGNVSIRGEYQQSFTVTTPESLNIIQIGIGYGM